MSDDNINNYYLDLVYKLVRLLDARKEIWVELLDYEEGFKAWGDGKRDAYVVKLKNKIAQLDQTLAQIEESLSEIIKRAQDCGVESPGEGDCPRTWSPNGQPHPSSRPPSPGR